MKLVNGWCKFYLRHCCCKIVVSWAATPTNSRSCNQLIKNVDFRIKYFGVGTKMLGIVAQPGAANASEVYLSCARIDQ